VDAAVATAFAKPMVEPFMPALAGGGSFLVHHAKRGETVAIDASVEAPSACHPRCYELAEGMVQDLFTWRCVVGEANWAYEPAASREPPALPPWRRGETRSCRRRYPSVRSSSRSRWQSASAGRDERRGWISGATPAPPGFDGVLVAAGEAKSH
jgi:hypothetical protein